MRHVRVAVQGVMHFRLVRMTAVVERPIGTGIVGSDYAIQRKCRSYSCRNLEGLSRSAVSSVGGLQGRDREGCSQTLVEGGEMLALVVIELDRSANGSGCRTRGLGMNVIRASIIDGQTAVRLANQNLSLTDTSGLWLCSCAQMLPCKLQLEDISPSNL